MQIGAMFSTHIKRHINAPRARVYGALIDPRAIANWKFPDGMTCRVLEFNPGEGGSFRIALTYDDSNSAGKTTAHTDTYRGYFRELAPNQRIVEVDEFETDDPAFKGEMIITYTLTDANGGTDLWATHAGLPPGVSSTDNEAGWRMALTKLAAFVEEEHPHRKLSGA
jgi:uncharacterized protein YndB with AHSA1/START domain